MYACVAICFVPQHTRHCVNADRATHLLVVHKYQFLTNRSKHTYVHFAFNRIHNASTYYYNCIQIAIVLWHTHHLRFRIASHREIKKKHERALNTFVANSRKRFQSAVFKYTYELIRTGERLPFARLVARSLTIRP